MNHAERWCYVPTTVVVIAPSKLGHRVSGVLRSSAVDAVVDRDRDRADRALQERGAILILSVLVMILLLSLAAFATDLAAWYRQGQQQQRASDLASLNGVQAYDLELKTYFESHGADNWAGLTNATDKAEAEQLAFDAGLEAIWGVLATGGVVVDTSPTVVYDPTPPSTSSTATAVATDGTQVQITRLSNGSFTVTLIRPGKQYFSSVLSDAPEIARSSTAVISNCNADCSRNILIEPPFTGFEASGQGDGYRPLLWGDDEIWTVNHHSSGQANGNAGATLWGGEIICMDRDTGLACLGGTSHFSLNGYQSANMSIEYLSPSGKLYFAARRPDSAGSVNGDVGLVCFDVTARAYCATPFTPMWEFNDYVRWDNWINAVGPWEYGGNLYIMSTDGVLHCRTESTLADCGSASTSATGIIPAGHTGREKIQGEVIGTKLFFTITYGGTVFGCFDLAGGTDCPGWSTAKQQSNLGWGNGVMTFMRYTTGGAHGGICALTQNTGAGTRSACYNTVGGSLGALPNATGLTNVLTGKGGATWAGSTFAWSNQRTYFGSGSSDYTGCYDWTIPGTCAEGSIDHLTVHGKKIEPYHYEQVTPDCIVGLGDESHFFSFNPISLLTCTESVVTTEIWPCNCGNGTTRWGVLELPPELLTVLNSANAEVTAPGHPALTGNLMDGPMDLSPLNGYSGAAQLTITVDSKVNGDGTLQWTEPYSANLALVVQPTLSN